MSLKSRILQLLEIPSSRIRVDLPGSRTLAEVVNAPQENARPVCGGDPFISDPCPVKDCKLGCDEPY